MRRAEKKGLGRGLSALLGEVEGAVQGDAAGGAGLATVPIDLIRANPDQPRRRFVESELEELASSIRERGVIQPVILRPDPEREGAFQIVAGERRWRAAQRAGLHEIPAIRRDLDDRQVLEIAIIENVQRSDLNPLEEASGFQQLIDRFGYTQEALAQSMGKSRSHIANLLRLLNLPATVQDMVRDGQLSAGHARALVTATDPVAMAKAVIAEGLSVRALEERLRKTAPAPKPGSAPKASPETKDADTRALEADLSAAIRMRVSIDHKGAESGGELRIAYRSLEELDQLCQKLTD